MSLTRREFAKANAAAIAATVAGAVALANARRGELMGLLLRG